MMHHFESDDAGERLTRLYSIALLSNLQICNDGSCDPANISVFFSEVLL